MTASAGRLLFFAAAAAAALLFTAGAAMYPGFASARALVNLVGDNAFLGIAAIGAAIVILSGGIDLSVGSVAACSTILVAVLIDAGVHPIAAAGIAIASGGGFGLAMGGLIVGLRLQAFLVTLAGMFFARGIGFALNPRSLQIRHTFYSTTVHETLGVSIGRGVTWPLPATVFLAVLAAAIVLMRRTRLGLRVYAVGGDERAARLLGVPVARTKLAVYALAGCCSALAGVVFTMYTQSGDPGACVGLELDAIAAVVIGGTLLSGGVGSVGGAAVGVLILGLIQSLVMFQGTLNSWWARIAIGALMLVFLLAQAGVARAVPARGLGARLAPRARASSSAGV